MLSLTRCNLPALLLILSIIVVPSTVQAQETSRMRFVHWTYQDAASIPGDLTPRHGLYVLGGTAVVGGLSLLDKFISHEAKEGYHGAFATYVDIANELGGPPAKFPVAALFTVSLFTRNVRFQDAAFTSLEALAYSFVMNQGLKFITGRVRPEDATHQHQFKPFSGNSSFPSGHTSSAFAALTPWALYYPYPVGLSEGPVQGFFASRDIRMTYRRLYARPHQVFADRYLVIAWAEPFPAGQARTGLCL